jgi:hypothetical protein
VRTSVVKQVERLGADRERVYRDKLAGWAVATDDAVRIRRILETAKTIAHRTYEAGEWTVHAARRAIRPRARDL